MYWKILIIMIMNVMVAYADLTKDVLKAENILSRERERLSEIRKEIDKERVPLSKEIMKVNKSLEQKRESFRYQKNILMSSESGFDDLEKQLEIVSKEREYVNSLISEFYYSIPKTRVFADVLDKDGKMQEIIKDIISNESGDNKSSIERFLEEIHIYNTEKIGGREFAGNATDLKGNVINGIFSNYGPLTFFSHEKDNLRFCVSDMNRIMPVSVKDTGVRKEKLSNEKYEFLVSDINNGEAHRISELERGLSDEIEKGGYILYPIIGLGIISLFTMIFKTVSLWNIRLDMEDKIEQVLLNISECNKEKAFEIAESMGKPLAPVIYEGIHHMNASKEDIEEIMHEKILFQIPYLQKNLTILAVSAAASPLLGLLGTVTGMIHTFNLVTVFGSGKASLLSSGISEALITTKYGLVVAIPALLAHAYFSRKVRKIISRLEQLSIAFINGLKIKEICKR